MNRGLSLVTDQFERFLLVYCWLSEGYGFPWEPQATSQPFTTEAAEVEVTVSVGSAAIFQERGLKLNYY